MELNLTFSEAALDYIGKCIQKENGIGFRLSVKKTGCSGYSYDPSVVKEVNPNDFILEVDQDYKVYVDPSWLHLLDGIKIDFIEEKSLGLPQKKLIFLNPKEKSRCGCGESFHVDDKKEK